MEYRQEQGLDWNYVAKECRALQATNLVHSASSADFSFRDWNFDLLVLSFRGAQNIAILIKPKPMINFSNRILHQSRAWNFILQKICCEILILFLCWKPLSGSHTRFLTSPRSINFRQKGRCHFRLKYCLRFLCYIGDHLVHASVHMRTALECHSDSSSNSFRHKLIVPGERIN